MDNANDAAKEAVNDQVEGGVEEEVNGEAKNTRTNGDQDSTGKANEAGDEAHVIQNREPTLLDSPSKSKTSK